MTFLWPAMLWLALALPALVWAYVLVLRRRKRVALRYASLGLVREALGRGQWLRRHLPPALFLLSIAALLLAVARPSAVITLPSAQRVIILAIDVSLSMRASDVVPSRLEAAQAAAKAFVQEQPSDVRVGIITFAGTAAVVQAPTSDREALVEAIDRFQLQRHTAIGSGIIVSLATIFPEEGLDVEAATTGALRDNGRGTPIDKEPKAEKKPFKAVPPGSYPNAAIILLTDGRRTMGMEPLEAARLAADHGVRVYTVGFGTAAGAPVDFDGWSVFMRFDEETLKGIAEITRAEYFHASSAEDLKNVYQTLTTKFVAERNETEITALFAAAAAAFAVVAAALSLAWFNRVV